VSEVVLDGFGRCWAHLNEEPGGPLGCRRYSERCDHESAVNFSEVVAKLSEAGMSESAVRSNAQVRA